MSDNVNVPGYLTVIWIFLIVFIIHVIKTFADPKGFPWHSVFTITFDVFLSMICYVRYMLVPHNIYCLFQCTGRFTHNSPRCVTDGR